MVLYDILSDLWIMKFLIGKKQYMTQFFDELGNAHAATLVSVDPVVVTQVKTVAIDGYDAVQVGYGVRKEKNITQPERGHFGEHGHFAGTKEFAMPTDTSDVAVGKNITVDTFDVNDVVHVSGISKGKGFQGVVKRHNFAGGRRSHGQKHSEREPGSIGATGPQRVFKGTRMGGRMGTDRVTVKNLVVLAIDADNNQLLIKGALPGRRGTYIEIVGK